jgi:hypothetical protein
LEAAIKDRCATPSLLLRVNADWEVTGEDKPQVIARHPLMQKKSCKTAHCF